MNPPENGKPKLDPAPLNLPEKLAAAQQRESHWLTLAGNPNLSPMAAAWLLDKAKSSRASADLYRKALAYQEQIARADSGKLMGLDTLPQRRRLSSDRQISIPSTTPGPASSGGSRPTNPARRLAPESPPKSSDPVLSDNRTEFQALAQQARANDRPTKASPKQQMNRKSALERIAQAEEALQDPRLGQRRRQRYIRTIARAELELGLATHPSTAPSPNPRPRTIESETHLMRSQPLPPPENSSTTSPPPELLDHWAPGGEPSSSGELGALQRREIGGTAPRRTEKGSSKVTRLLSDRLFLAVRH